MTKKLNYNQQRELENLPQQIESLETQQADLAATISNPNFYNQDKDGISKTLDQMKSIGDQLDQCYKRWAELES